MTLTIDIQSASTEPVPAEDDIRRWVAATIATQKQSKSVELTVRLVDKEEMASLNETYRGKSGPTNVLSFPADLPDELEQPLLGDIVICAPIVREEAEQQRKEVEAHWAHMTVHGTLHLYGYDHVLDDEAAVMESIESNILSNMNYARPYENAATLEQSAR